MRLKQARQLERVHDVAVRALAGERVALVERALVLVDQHAVLPQRLVAVAVELHREQALARAEGVGRVDDDEVVFVLDAADVLEAVLIQDVHARVVQRAGDRGQVFAADRDHALVDLDQIDVLDAGIAAQLAHAAAVAPADDEHLFHPVAQHGEGDVHHHLMVDEFIALGQHHIAVERQEAAEFLALEHVDALEIALLGIQLAVDLNGQADGRRVHFGKCQSHGLMTPLITCRLLTSGSSVPSSMQFLSLA